MTLAAIINVEGKAVQLLVERPELQLVASWRLAKKSRAAGIISNKFLALLRLDVRHNDWHLHARERDTLARHKPVSMPHATCGVCLALCRLQVSPVVCLSSWGQP